MRHLQPSASRGEPGHGAAAVQLLHRLLPQHVPDRRPAPLTLQDGHVHLGAAVRLPLCGRCARVCVRTEEKMKKKKKEQNKMSSGNSVVLTMAQSGYHFCHHTCHSVMAQTEQRHHLCYQ